MNKIIGLELKALRAKSGLNLLEASEKVGITKDTLSRYEKDCSNIK